MKGDWQMSWKGIIEEYKKFLPVSSKTPVITMLEGNTPLIKSNTIGPALGINLYYKYEGLNPTGSFKDRGMTVAISKALEGGASAVICASTGNTSASAAAYSARSGITCIVIIPSGAVALGKLAQAIVHGAVILSINGNFDKALSVVKEISGTMPVTLVNSLNPYRIEGQKTAALEICDSLGTAPDYLAIPVGNAGNITAYWKGFKDYYESKKTAKTPVMLGFQASGASPIVKGRIFKNPKTIATAIRIGNPASWERAVSAARESRGLIDSVSDREIISAHRTLASKEGLFVEPASAASVAGIQKLAGQGFFPKNALVAAVLTGNGLKDQELVLAHSKAVEKISDSFPEIEKRIKKIINKKKL